MTHFCRIEDSYVKFTKSCDEAEKSCAEGIKKCRKAMSKARGKKIATPHLSNKEKEAIMKEKYMSTMKPVSYLHNLMVYVCSLKSKLYLIAAAVGSGAPCVHHQPAARDPQREELPGTVRGHH